MAFEQLYPPEILHKLLRYEPDTGRFFWLHRPREMFSNQRAYAVWNSRYAGKEAFTTDDPPYGYKQGYLLDKKVRAQRMAWAFHHGTWAPDHVDHINGDKADNRITNLRNVPNVINARNRNIARGVRITPNKKKWMACITVDYKTKHLGTFDSYDEARAARRSYELRHGFDPLDIK